ncbi:PEP-CTERM sorting domain-containing protein [Kiritimatiellaeota bacterium B1221]|nr:PEP-CTERM sorting domain-containing protein [Kiritimatiellaeota bacterium B1221]
MLVLVALVGSSACADVFYASGDTFYRRNEKNANYGSNLTIATKYDGTGQNASRVGMIRFDIGTFSGTASNSSFSIYLEGMDVQYEVDGNHQFRVYGVNDGNHDDLFNEDTLTFTTSNSNGGVAEWDGWNKINLASVTYLTTLSLESDDVGTMVSFSNSALDNFINADTNGTVSFVIQREELNVSVDQFRSSEGAAYASALATAPTLVVVPEPSSLLLLLGGFAASALLLRRRT